MQRELDNYYQAISDLRTELIKIKDKLQIESLKSIEKNNMDEFSTINYSQKILAEIFAICGNLIIKNRREITKCNEK